MTLSVIKGLAAKVAAMERVALLDESTMDALFKPDRSFRERSHVANMNFETLISQKQYHLYD